MARKKHTLDGRSSTEINWDSVMLGWAVAFGVGLLLISPVIGIFLMIKALGALQAAQLFGCVGAFVVAFVAFLYGGYISSVSAQRSGLRHGLLVPVLNLLVATSLVFLVLVSGFYIALARSLVSAVLPSVEQGAFTVWMTVSMPGISWPCLLGSFFLSFLGGALGGIWGVSSSYRNRRRVQEHERELVEAIRAN